MNVCGRILNNVRLYIVPEMVLKNLIEILVNRKYIIIYNRFFLSGTSFCNYAERNIGNMPTYEYRCKSCGYEFEEFQSMSAEKLVICPKCAEPSLKRLMSSGVGLLFKGSGFYQTDYKKTSSSASSQSKKPESKTESKAEPKSGQKSEQKPESKPDLKPEAKTQSKTQSKTETKQPKDSSSGTDKK